MSQGQPMTAKRPGGFFATSPPILKTLDGWDDKALAFVKFLSEPNKKDFWTAAGFELMTGD